MGDYVRLLACGQAGGRGRFPVMTSGSEAQPPHVAAPPATRAAGRPALLYVLGAFGLVAGAIGAQTSVSTGLQLLGPREAYVQAIGIQNQLYKSMVPAAELERWSQREGEVRYGRRNAALPLAAVGVILSLLLFAGCLRAMRGDAWGLSAWSLAAVAGIPYQLLTSALTLVMARDLTRVFADAPKATLPLGEKIFVLTLVTLVTSGLAILYYGGCILYLRTLDARAGISGDGRGTPPSA
jgi:hypothetical protein